MGMPALVIPFALVLHLDLLLIDWEFWRRVDPLHIYSDYK